MANLTASLVIYDIPQGATDPEGRPVRNPSNRLREFGVRVNLSCWIVPNHLIPYTLLNELRESGATWHVVKFDVSEAPKLVEMAANALREELLAAVDRAVISARAAGSRMNGEEPEEALAKYQRTVAGIIRRTGQLAERLETAAAGFGITPERIQVGHALLSLGGIQATADAKARIYASAIRELRELGWTGEGLAEAAETNSVHPGIMADYLDDMGGDTRAFRSAFREEILGAFAHSEQSDDEE